MAAPQEAAGAPAESKAADDKAKLEEQWPHMPNKAHNLPLAQDRAAKQ